jgi:hypothetical protein
MSSGTDLEQTYFEADRTVVILQLKALANAIEDGADKMKVAAADKLFDGQLTKTLTSEARALRQLARDVDKLRRQVARARFPKTRKSQSRARRRRR